MRKVRKLSHVNLDLDTLEMLAALDTREQVNSDERPIPGLCRLYGCSRKRASEVLALWTSTRFAKSRPDWNSLYVGECTRHFRDALTSAMRNRRNVNWLTLP
jgi:hypothetical protein